jgi:hypothetical protein
LTAVAIGEVIGLALGSALLGGLLAWMLRKVLPVSRTLSQLIGVSMMTVVYQIVNHGGHSLPAVIVHALVGGVLGFALLRLASRRAQA